MQDFEEGQALGGGVEAVIAALRSRLEELETKAAEDAAKIEEQDAKIEEQDTKIETLTKNNFMLHQKVQHEKAKHETQQNNAPHHVNLPEPEWRFSAVHKVSDGCWYFACECQGNTICCCVTPSHWDWKYSL